MKKIIVSAVFLSAIIGLNSCNKDYQCECTYQHAHAGHFDTETEIFDLTVKKKDSESTCKSKEAEINAEADHSDASCKLK